MLQILICTACPTGADVAAQLYTLCCTFHACAAQLCANTGKRLGHRKAMLSNGSFQPRPFEIPMRHTPLMLEAQNDNTFGPRLMIFFGRRTQQKRSCEAVGTPPMQQGSACNSRKTNRNIQQSHLIPNSFDNLWQHWTNALVIPSCALSPRSPQTFSLLFNTMTLTLVARRRAATIKSFMAYPSHATFLMNVTDNSLTENPKVLIATMYRSRFAHVCSSVCT